MSTKTEKIEALEKAVDDLWKDGAADYDIKNIVERRISHNYLNQQTGTG